MFRQKKHKSISEEPLLKHMTLTCSFIFYQGFTCPCMYLLALDFSKVLSIDGGATVGVVWWLDWLSSVRISLDVSCIVVADASSSLVVVKV